MQSRLWMQQVGKWLVVLALWGTGFAMAAPEPTLQQVYATAQAGKIAEAQVMIQQVLVSHPKSGKAFFVQAELYARQGKTQHARESLAYAEKYAPGLPFAKPEAVQALRTQLARANAAPVTPPTPSANYNPADSAAAPASSSASWAFPLLLAALAIAAGYFLFRKKAPQPSPIEPTYAASNGLNGPQTFGMGGGTMQPAYPQGPAYPSQYPAQTSGGLGGRIMGGVATGLALGAGVMAAEAIGRNLMGNHNANTSPLNDSTLLNDAQAVPTNYDMGGTDFGLNDTSSWDDGAGVDMGGGSDWDN